MMEFSRRAEADMRNLLMTIIAAAVAVSTVFASDKTDADAKAAIAFAKAKANRPMVAAQTRTVPYNDSTRTMAFKAGKPIFVTVSMDCRAVCEKLRPEFVTCHEEGDKPEARLEIPDRSRGTWTKYRWPTLPTDADVKAAYIKNKPRAESKQQEWEEAVSAMIAGMIALEPAGEPQEFVTEWRQVCRNGVCELVQVQVAKPMPSAGGPSVAAPPTVQYSSSSSGSFQPRFPRIAGLRSRFRSFAGLPRPRMFGQFVQAVEQEVAPEAMQGVQGPAPVGAEGVSSGRGHRLIKLYLLRNGVPKSDLDQFEQKYGDSSIWVDLLMTFLREGLPLLLEMIEKLLAK